MGWGGIAAMVGLGLGAGVVGGMFGIGGGLIIVPALILAFGFDQKTATGTSLMAQLLPVAILAVLEFWRRDQVDVPKGLGIAAGLVFGTLIGALITGILPAGNHETGLRRVPGPRGLLFPARHQDDACNRTGGAARTFCGAIVSRGISST